MPTETQTLKLDAIRIDGGTQPRVAIDEQVVAEYAESYAAGIHMPPVTVFFDGVTYWLADGFHRYWASRRIDRERIAAEVRQGTQRDAVLFSVGANADHGLRRTNADKRKAVLVMLEDDQWSQWSDREIARRCGVSDKTVGAARKSLSAEIPQMEASQHTVKYKRRGKTHTQRTARRSAARRTGNPNPVRQPRPALAQTNLNLPHDPGHGARAIVSAMGVAYARRLIEALTSYLQTRKGSDL